MSRSGSGRQRRTWVGSEGVRENLLRRKQL